jgi:hypothetical protein
MQLTRFAILALFFISFSMSALAQNGFIRGTVYDDATAETLPGVTVFVEGTTLGAITDFDGKFSISLPPGEYALRVSFISYETLNITNLKVTQGEATILDNLRLLEANIEIEGVVVSAEAIKNTEAAMLTMKRKSANLVDGISAVNLRKIGDSDAATSMKRVPGVSIQGGKYVFVRGLGDRYTKTILNGMDIPGLDPDRNTIQMDIFPTNVIDNIVVIKSFTADLPADFTGGVVNLETKDFPEQKKANVSISLGYAPGVHLNNNYLSYEGGKTDFLGFDDGTRTIPATENIPFFSEVVGNPDSEEGIRYREILSSFNPTLAAMKQQSFIDYGLGFSIGNQINRKKVSWGYSAAFSYKNETEFIENAEFGRYGLSGDKDVYEMETRELQSGNYGINSVLWSAMAGIALKTEKSKYRLNLLHLQNGESKAGIFDYQNADQGAVFFGYQHNLEYSQRSMTNVLLNGKHFFNDNNWEIEWKLSPTRSLIEDPDIRFTRYEQRISGNDTTFSIGTESGFPERIWRELSEINLAGQLEATKEFKMNGRKSKVNFGGGYVYKERDYVIRNFALNIRNVPLTGDPNELFFPENLWPLNGSASKGTTYEAPFVPVNPNQFDANTRNINGFVSAELGVTKNFKAIVGIRAENYTQFYTGQDQLGTIVFDNEKVLDNLDLFPSLNLIFNLNENQNLRFSYAKTIARPSFKELSYAEIFDPVTGRTFIGGLFRDANDVSGIEYWDGNLISTDIQNLDLRWEYYQPNSQFFSLSGFYKLFDHPIEMVQYATQTGSFQPRNVGDGKVIGLELEIRKNLSFASILMQNFSLNANFTYTSSSIKLSETEYQSRKENARTGQSVDEYRDMAGQAPYLINAGLAFNGGEKGFGKGLEAGIYYNVQGETLFIVGIVDRPDIYTVPFHSLNFNANKSFGKNNRMSVGFKVENILNEDNETVFKSYQADDQYFNRLSPGTKFTLRYSYNIF